MTEELDNREHTKEYKSVNIEVHRTPDGSLTCSLGKGKDCMFLQSVRFGFEHKCAQQEYGDCLKRGNEGLGYLIPHSDCILKG